MILIPLTSDGDRVVEVDVGSHILQFRTYWTGQKWLMDVSDTSGQPLMFGLALAPGVNNLMKGQDGGRFPGARLVAVLSRGSAYDPDNLGAGLLVYWQTDETDLYRVGDPLLG